MGTGNKKTVYAKSVCISLGSLERKILKDMKEMGVGTSMSECARFSIWYAWGKLQKMMANHERLVSRQDVKFGMGRKSENPLKVPEIIFVKNGKNYDKYQKVNNKR